MLRVWWELFFVLGVQGSVFGDGAVGVVVVAGEQVDGVGDGAGVLVGGDGAVGVNIVEGLGSDVEQVGGRPAVGVGCVDRRDQAGPGGVGGDGFGGCGAKDVVQFGDPGWPQRRVGCVQGGLGGQLGRQATP